MVSGFETLVVIDYYDWLPYIKQILQVETEPVEEIVQTEDESKNNMPVLLGSSSNDATEQKPVTGHN